MLFSLPFGTSFFAAAPRYPRSQAFCVLRSLHALLRLRHRHVRHLLLAVSPTLVPSPPREPLPLFHTVYTVHRTPETSPPLPLPPLASPGPIPPPSRPSPQPTPGRATVRGDRRDHLQEDLTGPRGRGVKSIPRGPRPQWTLTSTLPSTTKTVTAC